MTTRAKKEQERAHLKEFLAFQGLEPSAITEGEPLDFRLEFADGRRLGVEVVGVDEHAETFNNALIDREVVPGVEKGLRERGLAVSVDLIWVPHLTQFAEAPRTINPFVANLVDVISRLAPAPGGPEVVLHHDEDDERMQELGLGGLATFAVARLEGTAEVHVVSNPMAFGAGDDAVLAKLRSKEGQLEEYRRLARSAPVWLLMVTGAAFNQNVSSFMVRLKEVETGFDRVFLLDLRERKVLALK